MLSFDARRVQGALFDLDGTLVDSLPDLHFAVCEVLKSWGLEPMEEEEVGRYIGKGCARESRTPRLKSGTAS